MATSGWPKGSATCWQFGAEFELSDWPQDRMKGWRVDRDWTLVNSNGVAVDSSGRVYRFGGEILAHPSDDPAGVAGQLEDILAMLPEAVVNYRSSLHIHVRIPGLSSDLGALKQLQRYSCLWLPHLLPLIEPMPQPRQSVYGEVEAYKGARRFHNWRRTSHQKIISEATLQRQLRARTAMHFFEAEALHEPSGRVLWATRPRAAVNLRQLRATDTVEFRHFPGTLSADAVLTAVEWCRDYLEAALDCADPVLLYERTFRQREWPQLLPYVHWMELVYKRTSLHYVGVSEARRAIREYLGCAYSSSVMETVTALRCAQD